MFDTIPNAMHLSVIPATSVDELRSFVGEHRNALLDAADLLGGSAGIQLLHTAIDGLAEHGEPSRLTMRALDELLDLLMLEHVHDSSRIDAALFASIDPSSACVEEICLLADQLNDRLNACREASVSLDESARRDAA